MNSVNNSVNHYYNVLETRQHDYSKHRQRVETIQKLRDRPNPESVLMTYSEYIEHKKNNKKVVDVYV